jgi:hypothetical protein
MSSHSRGLTLALNKKNQEIKQVLELKDQMVNFNIDIELINEYVDEQYKKIILEYETKIAKYQQIQPTKHTQLTRTKKKKDIDNLLKNKAVLELKGYNPSYIKKYVDSQYLEINNKYSRENNVSTNNDNINFIED